MLRFIDFLLIFGVFSFFNAFSDRRKSASLSIGPNWDTIQDEPFLEGLKIEKKVWSSLFIGLKYFPKLNAFYINQDKGDFDNSFRLFSPKSDDEQFILRTNLGKTSKDNEIEFMLIIRRKKIALFKELVLTGYFRKQKKNTLGTWKTKVLFSFPLYLTKIGITDVLGRRRIFCKMFNLKLRRDPCSGPLPKDLKQGSYNTLWHYHYESKYFDIDHDVPI
jgi:hypothetical protein